MTKKLFFVSVLALVLLWFKDRGNEPVTHPPGVLAPAAPLQVQIQPSRLELGEYLVTKKARFDIRARILGIEPYHLGREADLSPLDLALGWGVMSDQSVLDRIRITQSGRWYYTRYEFPAPLPDREIIRNSGNMHMIPAEKWIEKELKKLRRGDLVRLQGYLVDVDADSGWRWRTSLTREDTGGGSCEILYVDYIEVEG